MGTALVVKAEASRTASFPRRCGTARPHFLPAARYGTPAYTPAVRRWACIVAFLVGFSGNGYVWTVRPRIPVPVERLLDPRRPDPAIPEAAWWRTS